MIDTIKNSEDLVVAYAVWTTVDLKGQIDPKGDYVFIEEVWIHEQFRESEVLAALINMIDKKAGDQAQKVYWKRGKYNDRICGAFPRDRIISLVNKKYKGE